MPPSSHVHACVAVSALSALVASGVVLVEDFSDFGWDVRTVSVLRTIGGMILEVAAVAFILVEEQV